MISPAHSGVATSSASSLSGSQLAALLKGAGISPLKDAAWVRITGEDRVRWLNGMVTNSVQHLQPGQGAYTFLLNVQGQIQGDAFLFAEPNAILLETSTSQLTALLPWLDRYIIMDDVAMEDTTGTRAGLSVTGPQAVALLAQLGLPSGRPGFSVGQLGPLEMQTLSWNSADVTVIHGYSPLVPRFELWTDAATSASLSTALLATGAMACEPESQEWLRLLEGTPLFGKDIRGRELPQETGQNRALHFSKGCYLGQEIVERIRSRGNVHRTFTAFRLEGTLPAAGSALEADGKPVGELTSVAAIPLPTPDKEVAQLALGYVRREALDRGAALHYPGGIATPATTPFLPVETTELHPAS
jgi:folate-binding protein YgfZ